MYDYVPFEESIDPSALSGADCFHYNTLHLITSARYNSQGNIILIFYYEIFNNDFNFMMSYAM